jgi:hypothetical protein
MNQKMFIVVRNTKSTENNHDYQLCVGDIIKLGRIKLKVKNFFGSGKPFAYTDKICIDGQCSARNGCKICWGAENCEENPLLNSCNCDGSVRYIHYKCLKYWLQQKMVRKEVENHIVSYSWKTFECEICKKAYPYTF